MSASVTVETQEWAGVRRTMWRRFVDVTTSSSTGHHAILHGA
jgi:hypothetical protein